MGQPSSLSLQYTISHWNAYFDQSIVPFKSTLVRSDTKRARVCARVCVRGEGGYVVSRSKIISLR